MGSTRYISSSIGRKQLMGATGLIWSGFVLTHMLGNMLIFVGADAYNSYSHALVSNPLIYLAEAFLLLTILAHAVKGIQLTFENRSARQSKYAMPTNGKKAARFQSKFMIFHGSMVLVFIILHLITFKYGPHYTTTVGGVEMRDIYKLVIEVFHEPLYVAWYAVALIFVGLHLSHGFYSAFASLGLYHPRYTPILSKIGYVYAAVIAAGFLSQPIYVYFCAN
jgi:succinate dehydrogenase / fumarate reductase cytochrome b subunit